MQDERELLRSEEDDRGDVGDQRAQKERQHDPAILHLGNALAVDGRLTRIHRRLSCVLWYLSDITLIAEPQVLDQGHGSRRRCVSRIYTDLAVLDVTPAGLAVRELVDGLSLEELERCTTLEARS